MGKLFHLPNLSFWVPFLTHSHLLPEKSQDLPDLPCWDRLQRARSTPSSSSYPADAPRQEEQYLWNWGKKNNKAKLYEMTPGIANLTALFHHAKTYHNHHKLAASLRGRPKLPNHRSFLRPISTSLPSQLLIFGHSQFSSPKSHGGQGLVDKTRRDDSSRLQVTFSPRFVQTKENTLKEKQCLVGINMDIFFGWEGQKTNTVSLRLVITACVFFFSGGRKHLKHELLRLLLALAGAGRTGPLLPSLETFPWPSEAAGCFGSQAALQAHSNHFGQWG